MATFSAAPMLVMLSIAFPSIANAQTQNISQAEVSQLKQQVSELREMTGVWGDLPRGAVIAFNLTKCPARWHPFASAAGRTVIGTGRGAGLTPRELGDLGGEEQHTLTIDEMPAHSHPGNVSVGGHSYEHHQYNGRMPGERWQNASGSTGGSRPHNNMPPFVALLYCEKE